MKHDMTVDGLIDLLAEEKICCYLDSLAGRRIVSLKRHEEADNFELIHVKFENGDYDFVDIEDLYFVENV